MKCVRVTPKSRTRNHSIPRNTVRIQLTRPMIRGEQIFQKSESHFKILDARCMTRNDFHTSRTHKYLAPQYKFIRPANLAPS